ncbi:T9SS type A sorting domain-containing protein [Bacteroidota bacterium]
MKKFTLLCTLIAFSVFTFGQNVILKEGIPKPVKAESENSLQINSNEIKGDGDIFWHHTFDWGNPDDVKGWTAPDGWLIGDETVDDLGYTWLWRDDTLNVGCCTNQAPMSYSETPEDGFIVLPGDEYNTLNDGSFPVNSWFQTPPIDCSGVPSVVITFKQLFRTCCSGSATHILKVSNDDGVHWAEYDLRYATPVNDATVAKGRNVEINISNVAAGNSEVLIRIQWDGSSHYYWMIDDMRLAEAYHNELQLDNRWAWFNDGDPESAYNYEGFLPYIPLSQIGGANNFGEYSFQASVINSGIDDLTNVHLNVDILKNGVSVFNDLSPMRDVETLVRDTFWTANNYMADDYGDYLINWTVNSDEDDLVPENNSDTYMFTVNDSVYSRVDDTAEASQSTGGWVGGNNDGDYLGVVYTVTQATEANSMSVYIWGSNEVTAACQYILYKWDTEEEAYVEVIASELVELDSTILDVNWLTLPFEKDGETEFIEAGEYIAAIQMWKGDSTNTFRIGYDKTTYCPSSKTLMKWVDGDGWGTNSAKLNMIRMNFNETGGPSVAPVEFNVDMNIQIAMGNFNPANDYVDFVGTINDWAGSSPLTDEDEDGVYTIEIPDLTFRNLIEYKYRINGNDATSEEDSREYQVRYWNILDDIYNDDAIVGVDDNPVLSNSVKVYPNPTSGQLNVVINNTTQSDLIIKLMNVQGQVVYLNTVKSVLNHIEVIDIDLAKGMYLLNVNNGTSIKVEKIIVR